MTEMTPEKFHGMVADFDGIVREAGECAPMWAIAAREMLVAAEARIEELERAEDEWKKEPDAATG